MTRQQIMALIPKEKREAVYDAWEDSDGVWIMLKPGWNADRMDSECRTIHEGGEDEPRSTLIHNLKYQIAGIRRVKK